MATISVCMIVKDEEPVISRCLDCVKSFADEIIIADTGSQDNTPSIAKQYTPFVYDFPWQDDFSAARNFSFSKATQDYQMWLDADDVISLSNQKQLSQLKQHLTADVVMLPYHVAFDADNNPVFTYYRERILKRDCHFQWQGAVHETITPSGTILYAQPAIEHRKLHVNDPDRNLRIFETLLSKHQPLNTREKFYYARELFYHQQYEKALLAYLDFLNQADGWKENQITACQQMAQCCIHLNQTDTALQALFQSFLYDSPRAEICCDIGKIKFNQKKYQEAIFWYETALHTPYDLHQGGFSIPDCHDYIPYIQLCVCYDRIGNIPKAKTYNDKAGRIKPKDKAYLFNQQYFNEMRNTEN